MNRSGQVVDPASRGTAAKGEACFDQGVEGFVGLLRDVAAFDLARLTSGPLAR